MSKERAERVAEEIRKILAEAIRSEMKDPRMPKISSVTHVKLSRDLAYADIQVSCLGGEIEKKDMMTALDKANGFLRSKVAHEMGLRVAPELRFHLDESIEIGQQMSALIDQVRAEDEARDKVLRDKD